MIRKQISLSLTLLFSVTLPNSFVQESCQESKEKGQEDNTEYSQEESGVAGKAQAFLSYLASLTPMNLSQEEENLIEDCYSSDRYSSLYFYDPKNNAVADYPFRGYYNNDWPIVKIGKDTMYIWENFGLKNKEDEKEENFTIYTIFRQPKLIGRTSSREDLDIECSGNFAATEDEDPLCARLYAYIEYGEKAEQQIFPVELVITDDQNNKVARYRAVVNVKKKDKNSLIILSSSLMIPLSGRCQQVHERAFKELVTVANELGCNGIVHRASRLEVDYYYVTWFEQLQRRGIIPEDMIYHT